MPSSPLPARADVVVIGAGVIGASIAWHVATSTDLSVAVLERGSVGSGSTSRSAAAFRQQFSAVEHVRMSTYSAEAYARFPDTFGVDVFVRNGYLFLYRQEEALRAAAERAAFQKAEGVEDVAVLSPPEVDALPGLSGAFDVGALAGATWCPSDGFLRPSEIAATYMEAAVREGATLHSGARVVGIRTQNGRVAGVDLAGGGRLACGAVVVAAGWWSRAVAEMANAPIPLVAVKRYLYITPQLDPRRVEHFPLVVGDLGPYARPESNALMMGWDERPERPPGWDRHPPPPQEVGALEEAQDRIEPGYGRGIDDYGIEVLASLAEFMPWLGDEGGIEHVTCGYYEITPDDKAILGEDPRVAGLFHASGFSGHGIMHAPAAGRAVADLIAARTPPFAMDGFALAPLLDNRPRSDPERMVI